MIKAKEFKRNVCFTFFEDYRMTAKEIEEDLGLEEVAIYYNAIIDYALYEIEPEKKGVLKYTWPTTKKMIDKSIERRASGFGEDMEKTEKVLEYVRDHQGASQREIAEATGVSLGKVHKVLKKMGQDNSNTNTDAIASSHSNTIREREHEQGSSSPSQEDSGEPSSGRAEQSSSPAATQPVERKRTGTQSAETYRRLKELPEEELDDVLEKYRRRVDYKEIMRSHRIAYGELDGDLPTKVSGIKEERKKEERKEGFRTEFSDHAGRVIKASLMNKTNLSEDELLECLSGLKVETSALEVEDFLSKEEVGTYEEYKSSDACKQWDYCEYLREILNNNLGSWKDNRFPWNAW